ncbi:MAG: glycoside hydrolase family 2 protein, partial [Clostridia bacterium]|nr:glycoside hydrolase family 2 protein [Clostridia bacterium]
MREILNLNDGWLFSKGVCDTVHGENAEAVSLPHTWNAIDGQDGGNDYFRGASLYTKKINKSDLPAADKYYLEIRGANSSADVYVDGIKLAHHDG